MNQDQFKGKWKQFKGEVKKTWGNLTEDDFAHSEGDMDSLVGKIQEKYGDAKEVVKQKLDAMLHKLHGSSEPAPSQKKRDVA